MYFLSVRTLLACGVILVISGITHGLPANITTYDQRQTGDVNIHISVKDLKIIALLGGGLGGSEDYDYNYDYSELTVKPPHSNSTTSTSTSTVATTTKKDTQDVHENVLTTEKIVEITPPSPILILKPNSTALNPTHKPNSTILHAAHKLNETENSNKNQTFTNVQRPGNVRPNAGIPVQILTTPVEVVYNHKVTKNSTTSTLKPETSSAATIDGRQGDCIEGYRKDQRGICRPKIKRPAQQTLLRKLIQLSHRMQTLPNKRMHPNQ